MSTDRRNPRATGKVLVVLLVLVALLLGAGAAAWCWLHRERFCRIS